MSHFAELPEDLMRHAAALRRVALAIVRDEAAAEDVVQSAYITALERPRQAAGLPWLVRVVQRRAIDFLRRRRAREQHEAIRAGMTEPTSCDQIAERVESLGLVVESMRELPEPLQQVLYLRYFEGQSPTEIAGRIEIPVKTVKTRLSRALFLMRGRLERHFGTNQGSWHAHFLVPLGLSQPTASGISPVASPLTPTALVFMSKKLVGALCVVAVLVGFYFAGDGLREASPDAVHAPTEPRNLAQAQPPTSLPQDTAPSARELVLAPPVVEKAAVATADEEVQERETTRSFWCRVVAADSGLPIPGAEVFFMNGNGGIATGARADFQPQACDARGLIEIKLPPGLRPEARVQASGFGDLVFKMDEAHATAAEALDIRLTRSASLTVRLTDSSGAGLPGGSVVLLVPFHELAHPDTDGAFPIDVSWRETTGEAGLVRIDNLPVGVGIQVSLVWNHAVVRQSVGDLVLTPGEHRELAWSLGGGVDIHGKLLDQFGQPVKQRDMWLATTGLNENSIRDRFYFVHPDKNRVIQRARTDDAGLFQFEDVEPARCFVGPAVAYSSTTVLDAEAVAPLATLVPFTAEGQVVPLELVVSRGLYIQGHVEEPDGAVVNWCFAQAYSNLGGARGGGASSPTGDFVLGPLEPSVHRILISPTKRSFQANGSSFASADLEILAPSSGVVVVLAEGASLSGHCVDAATGNPCVANVAPANTDTGWAMGFGGAQAAFNFDGLGPGTYSLAARTPDGLLGFVRGQELSEGQQIEDIEIRLEPAAKLVVHYTGPREYANVRVYCDGALIATDGVQSGSSFETTVPAREFLVHLSYQENIVAERRLRCTVGEVLETRFEVE